MHPEIADMVGDPSENDSASTSAADVAIAEAAAQAQANLSRGLDELQLIPRDEEGKAKLSDANLLDHMCKFRNQMVGAEPSSHLSLEIGERQMEAISPTEDDLRRGRILKDATMESSRKLAARKLNNIGSYVGHSTVINSQENTKRMEEDLRLAATIEAVRADEKMRAESKAAEAQRKYRDLAPEASKKLVDNGGDTSKLQKKHLAALLLVVYSVFLDPKKPKNKHSVFVDSLNKAIEANPNDLSAYHEKVGDGNDNTGNGGNNEPAAEGDEDDDEMEVDNEDEGDEDLDDDDYVGKRVAAFREGSIRLGTVTECGEDKDTGVIGWNIEFDDDDVVVYKDGDRGKDENFSLKELEEGIQLYEEEGFVESDN